MIKRPRVVITGMGVLAANGIGLPAFWDSIVQGRSGIGPITLFDTSRHNIQVGGEIKNFSLSDFVNGQIKAKKMARHTQFAVAAAKMAVNAAGLTQSELKKTEHMAINFGVSTSAIEIIEQCYHQVHNHGPEEVSSHLLAASQPNDVTAVLGDYFGVTKQMTLSTACNSGVDALAHSEMMIRQGKADLVIAGGTDAPLNALILASFVGSGILTSAKLADYPMNCPFDLHRKGGLLAEGSAVLVVERLEHALARGAEPLAEILGHGSQTDGNRAETLKGLTDAIRLSLFNAGVSANDIQHISAHGPGHPHLDILECRAIKHVFGEMAQKIPVCSIKGSVGNPLSAAGIMQVVAGVMSIQTGLIPPTANLEVPDPECDVDLVQGAPRYQRVDAMLVNSHGMGGPNTSVVIGRCDAV